ncbi:hypothetical protein GGF32_001514 [Allomyces javanicus]|nr:hypothetical protein GGF32_001514 [Allomyces javanicus]
MAKGALSLPAAANWKSSVVVCGNPGAGKSTLINSLLGRVVFPSGVSLGTGMTTVQQSHDGPLGVRIFDTPGILDAGTGANPAAELAAALDAARARPTRLIIVAGVGASPNLVRYEDVEMIKIVMSLVRQRVAGPIDFGLILNQARGKAFAALCDEVQRETVVKDLCNGQLVPNIVLPFSEDVEGEDNALLPREQIEHVFAFLKQEVHCLKEVGQHELVAGTADNTPMQEVEMQPQQPYLAATPAMMAPTIINGVPSAALGAAPSNSADDDEKYWKSSVVVCGNPGAGKSTLLNTLVGAPVFSSGVSLGTGKTTVQGSYLVRANGVRFFDTPGILDTDTGGTPANELIKAISMAMARPTRLVIVVGVGAYPHLINYADVEMIKLVTSLIAQQTAGAPAPAPAPVKFGLILNRARGRALDALQDPVQCKNVVKELYGRWKATDYDSFRCSPCRPYLAGSEQKQ